MKRPEKAIFGAPLAAFFLLSQLPLARAGTPGTIGGGCDNPHGGSCGTPSPGGSGSARASGYNPAGGVVISGNQIYQGGVVVGTIGPDGACVPGSGPYCPADNASATVSNTLSADPSQSAAPPTGPSGAAPPPGDLNVDPQPRSAPGDLRVGQAQAAPSLAAARGRVLGEIKDSVLPGASHAGLSETARTLQAMVNAPLPERARHADADPREIQVPTDRKIAQIAGPLDAPATARKAAQDKLFNNALTKMKMRDWRAALDDLTILVTSDPADAAALQKRAEVENHLGMYKEAEQDARKAIALDPTNAGAWQQLAWSLLKQGRYQEALEAINRALRLEPSNADDYAIRSCIKEMLGDRDGALADLEKAASLDARYRGKLDLARKGGRIYDPDAEQDSIRDMVSSGRGDASRRPLALAGLAVLLFVALGAGLAYRFGKTVAPPAWTRGLDDRRKTS